MTVWDFALGNDPYSWNQLDHSVKLQKNSTVSLGSLHVCNCKWPFVYYRLPLPELIGTLHDFAADRLAKHKEFPFCNYLSFVNSNKHKK